MIDGNKNEVENEEVGKSDAVVVVVCPCLSCSVLPPPFLHPLARSASAHRG